MLSILSAANAQSQNCISAVYAEVDLFCLAVPEQEVKREKVNFNTIIHLFAQLRNYFPNQSSQTSHMPEVKGWIVLLFLSLVRFSVPFGMLFSSK